MHEPTNLLPYFSRHMNLNLTLPHIGSDQRDLSRIYICTHGKSASLRASVSLFVGYYFPKRRREIRLRPSSRSFANAFGVSPQDAHRDALQSRRREPPTINTGNQQRPAGQIIIAPCCPQNSTYARLASSHLATVLRRLLPGNFARARSRQGSKTLPVDQRGLRDFLRATFPAIS
jgi:hypothetical protein